MPETETPPLNLALLQYEFVGRDGQGERLLYRKRGLKSFNLHVVARGSPWASNARRLVKFLRKNRSAAEGYGRRKIEILNTGSWTLTRYTNEKADAIKEVLKAALGG